ncbi:hypothetical protein T07_4580 [Trichinella nelsoni]|uniref:Retrovirus-related Pol polyprotein from transposon TNT 1-94 n=1 Tax=Trichinella nelsoni TaxID=6336 RepID=A0A0V0S7Y3_9BILA|nr:hypothetical protein T07_4580 [Trichinella nelsoni]
MPHEKWFGKRPAVEHLRVFGCDAYVHIPSKSQVFDTHKHRVNEVTDVKFSEHPANQNACVFLIDTKCVAI